MQTVEEIYDEITAEQALQTSLSDLDIWTPGETIDDIISENSDFAINCKRWYSVEETVTSQTNFLNPKSMRIMNSICPITRNMFTSSNLPLYMVTQNEYVYPTELENYIHNPRNPEKIKARYDANGVECWTLGANSSTANGNPVPSTPDVAMPDAWIKDKLGIT